ncbi:hypothetical protein B0H14DRAFT_2631055 [Mycena olivaceomarginata]|nr:hypothetical protein B0H14DRAFT_2631055 [Mycena olivaceomarginata]
MHLMAFFGGFRQFSLFCMDFLEVGRREILRGLLLEDFQGKVGKETLQHMRQSHTVNNFPIWSCHTRSRGATAFVCPLPYNTLRLRVLNHNSIVAAGSDTLPYLEDIPPVLKATGPVSPGNKFVVKNQQPWGWKTVFGRDHGIPQSHRLMASGSEFCCPYTTQTQFSAATSSVAYQMPRASQWHALALRRSCPDDGFSDELVPRAKRESIGATLAACARCKRPHDEPLRVVSTRWGKPPDDVGYPGWIPRSVDSVDVVVSVQNVADTRHPIPYVDLIGRAAPGMQNMHAVGAGTCHAIVSRLRI